MSETLFGVMIGGLLASIVPVLTLFTDSRRWSREKQLDHLASERARLEALFSRTLEYLNSAMTENSYSSQMISDIMVLMPKPISDRFDAWMMEKPKDELKAKSAYLDICLEMKIALAGIDAKIAALIHDRRSNYSMGPCALNRARSMSSNAMPQGSPNMVSKPLLSDEEYAKEVRSHSNYLNWIFGLSTNFLAIACLQFATPWHAAVICLSAVAPMYFYAFASFPTSLKVLRRLYKETKSEEVKNTINHLQRKFHGWRVIFTNLILWLGLVLYFAVLFSDSFKPFVVWAKA